MQFQNLQQISSNQYSAVMSKDIDKWNRIGSSEINPYIDDQ